MKKLPLIIAVMSIVLAATSLFLVLKVQIRLMLM